MNRRGLTLVELLVAVVILSVALAGLVSLWSFSYNVTQGSQDTAVAYSIARREIERVRDIGFDNLPRKWQRVQGYDFGSTSGTWEETTATNSHFTATTTMDPYVSSADEDTITEGSLRIIRVQIRQREGNAVVVTTESALTRGGV